MLKSTKIFMKSEFSTYPKIAFFLHIPHANISGQMFKIKSKVKLIYTVLDFIKKYTQK